MRLSDKMTQTRHNLDEVYESLGDSITYALNEMFEYGAEAEQERIIALIGSKEWVGQTLAEDVDNLVQLIKGNK